MFSSNQVLEISGDLRHRNDLRDALDFAIKKSGWDEAFTRAEKPAKCTFQVTEKGDFCIGWCNSCDAWNEFQFEYNVDIIAAIAEQHISKQKVVAYGGDGGNSKGFLLKAIDYDTEGVKEPFYGIVILTAYNCYYAK